MKDQSSLSLDQITLQDQAHSLVLVRQLRQMVVGTGIGTNQEKPFHPLILPNPLMDQALEVLGPFPEKACQSQPMNLDLTGQEALQGRMSQVLNLAPPLMDQVSQEHPAMFLDQVNTQKLQDGTGPEENQERICLLLTGCQEVSLLNQEVQVPFHVMAQ